MNRKARLVICLSIVALVIALPSPLPCSAEEDWKAEFDDICSKTIDAMALPPDEIRSLIGRCDRLRPRIERLEETASKVYLRRLRMCRELFVFVLENPREKQ